MFGKGGKVGICPWWMTTSGWSSTEFLRQTGSLKLAQMLAGHAEIGTTANI